MTNESKTPLTPAQQVTAVCTTYLFQQQRLIAFGGQGRFGLAPTGTPFFAVRLLSGGEELRVDAERLPERGEVHAGALVIDGDEYMLLMGMGSSAEAAQDELNRQLVEVVTAEVGNDGVQRMLAQFREAGAAATLRPKGGAAGKKRR